MQRLLFLYMHMTASTISLVSYQTTFLRLHESMTAGPKDIVILSGRPPAKLRYCYSSGASETRS